MKILSKEGFVHDSIIKINGFNRILVLIAILLDILSRCRVRTWNHSKNKPIKYLWVSVTNTLTLAALPVCHRSLCSNPNYIPHWNDKSGTCKTKKQRFGKFRLDLEYKKKLVVPSPSLTHSVHQSYKRVKQITNTY